MQSGTKKQNIFLDLTKEKKGAEKSWLMLFIYITQVEKLCLNVVLSTKNITDFYVLPAEERTGDSQYCKLRTNGRKNGF
jgi:hypothetical protein